MTDQFKRIQHNLEVAKVPFLEYIRQMDEPLAKWFQYRGFEMRDTGLWFKFKSSQCSLRFEVYAGVGFDWQIPILYASAGEIYTYFRNIKYEQINNRA